MQDLKALKNDLVETSAMGCSLTLAVLILALSLAIPVAFVGQLGQSELAGTGLANSLAMLTCWGTTAGLCSAAETLFSQAYGSSNKRKVGLDFQRTIIFVFVGFVIATTINLNCDLLFIVLGQDPLLACIAKRYLTTAAPGYFFFFYTRLLISYLRVLGVHWPIIVSPALGCCTMTVFSYLFLGYGLDGVAMAQNFGHFGMFLVCVVYIFWSNIYQKTWQSLGFGMFDCWRQIMKLSLAGVLLSMSEYLFLQFLTLLAGTMDEISLAAQTANYQLFEVLYGVSFGMGGAGAIRVGYFLGASEPQRARNQVYLTLGLTLIVQFFFNTVAFVFRSQLLGLFTKDEQVIELGNTLVLVMVVQQLVQAIYMVFLGGMKGTGRQAVGSIANIICMYFIGTPILIGTVFGLGWGIVECWALLIGIYTLLAIVFIVLVLTTNFEIESAKAQERIGLLKDIEPRANYETDTRQDYSDLDGDSVQEVVIPEKQEKWRSLSEIVGKTTSQASKLNLKISPLEIPSSNPRSVAFRKVAVIIMATLFCSGLVGMNLTGFISVEMVFGPMHTFINSTTVDSCAYLIR